MQTALCLQDVVRTAAELGWSGMQLAPLDVDASSGASVAADRGAGAKSGAPPNQAAAPEADEALLLGQLREALGQRLRAAAPGSSPQMLACLMVRTFRGHLPCPRKKENLQTLTS